MVLHFGDFSVGFGSRQLLREAKESHLGPKAFELPAVAEEPASRLVRCRDSLSRPSDGDEILLGRVLPPVSARTEAGK